MIESILETTEGVKIVDVSQLKKQYCIHNQLTGQLEFAESWDGIWEKRKIIQDAYLKHNEGLFAITELIQGTDGAWTQQASALYDEFLRSQ